MYEIKLFLFPLLFCEKQKTGKNMTWTLSYTVLNNNAFRHSGYFKLHFLKERQRYNFLTIFRNEKNTFSLACKRKKNK